MKANQATAIANLLDAARGVLEAIRTVWVPRVPEAALGELRRALERAEEALTLEDGFRKLRSTLDREDAALLVDSGLLFEVNRRVLHPLGLALAVECDGTADGATPLMISPHLVRTDDPEGIVFTDEALEDGFRKLKEFMRAEGFPRLARRYEAFGFRTQVPADVDPNADAGDWGPFRLRVTRAVADALLAAARLLEHVRSDALLAEALRDVAAEEDAGVDPVEELVEALAALAVEDDLEVGR
jgi:hypothetical protein